VTRELFVVVALWSCGCASTPAQPAATAGAPNASSRPAGPTFDSESPARIETSTCALELTSEPVRGERASTAQPSRIALVLEGRGGYHVNLEYPLRVELGGSSGAQLAKVTLGPVDASELSESSARFDTHVRWKAAGPHWLAARVQFAVCTADACVPQEHVLATKLHVR
jgi:hypothetical protein